jgi:hypothetical protein
MQKNVGGYDRIARLILGPALIVVVAAVFGGYLTLASGLLGAAILWAGLVVGAVFVVTGATQKCPINSLLGFNTVRGSDESSPEMDSDSGAGRPM